MLLFLLNLDLINLIIIVENGNNKENKKMLIAKIMVVKKNKLAFKIPLCTGRLCRLF